MNQYRRGGLVAGLALLLTACGGDEERTPAVPQASPSPVEPRVEAVPAADKARYALDRLTKGPRPTHGLAIGDLHRKNLGLARRDLIATPMETLRLLGDEALIRRLTTAHPNNLDPWHNVLSVLTAIRAKPPALVTQWTAPAVASSFATLRRHAIRVLASEPHVANAPVVFALLERDPQDREIAQLAMRTLFGFGDLWRRRALDVLFRDGSPLMWTRVAESIEASVPPEVRGGETASALFWWQALTEGSGPRLSARLPRVKRFPWMDRQIWLDPSVHRLEDGTPAPPFPQTNNGWIGVPLAQAGVFPSLAFALSGASPAADARCILAREGMAPFVASVLADRALPEEHALHRKALHCMLPGDEMAGQRDVMARLTEAVRLIVEEDAPIMPQVLGPLVDGLPPPDLDAESRALLERIVQTLPALPAAKLVVDRASDRLAVLGPNWLEFVEGLLNADDDVGPGRALRLIFRANDVRFLDALEAYRAKLPPEGQEALYRRLVFLYASGRAEPARTERFVVGLVKRLDTAPEADVRGMSSALLDFGEVGAAAYARGLSGPRRRLYLDAWSAQRQVPLVVARAAVAPLGAQSDPGEVARVLSLAFYSFPETAAPALKALAGRLRPEQRAWVEPVLERVRHRASR